ncbi:NADH-quinone oxidoreductase subunit L [Actinocrinis sp.]|uniref:NADH-quinone oxidoreductase subunit L n=1 Tax=Actinocrinis sp. TaxID=1920516 RepID=UPI002D2BC5FD|nr:NADH-quinone oxidoreductase subunit L [Actinocrinis sp.]HZP53248.1 NADH-quinone oxidoreductase subunit L [Actinocrinis sp.]
MPPSTYAPVAATGVFTLTAWVVALPMIGAAILLIGGKRTNRWGHLLGCLAALGSFALGAVLFFSLLGKAGDARSYDQHVYTWVPVPGFSADAGFHLDQLSMTFVLLITGVGSLIHIYSVGYMAHDENRRKFFGYLNLFLAAMLVLVLANNYLLLYAGWEGVGLASYLLIGFWQHKPSAAVAAKKAFIVNRVGDIGLSVGVMLMYTTFGGFAFSDVFNKASTADRNTILGIGLMLLLAACGKSAQFPLQSWLLDAMEGPTPVSALIHAATMVTAGVYLIVRSHVIFDLSPNARLLVTIVGAITLMMGAIIGCAKDDIKKALAGSTMSQIGYMVLGAGLGPIGYVFAIMHLVLHGFFKAGLFLGAGSVMHGMNDDVDMRHYGGLRKYMKITCWTFGFGYLAIIGCPPFSGFWSKDKIIEAAFAQGGTSGWVLGCTALLGAMITAFYMTRVMLMTFFGEKRWVLDEHGHEPHAAEPHSSPEPHESPKTMTIPMIILAVGSVAAGALFSIGSPFVNWLEPVTGRAEGHSPINTVALSLITLAVVALGFAYAWRLYGTKARPVPAIAPAGSPLTRAARRDLYGDAFNEAAFMRTGQWLTRLLVYFDLRGVDGVVNGVAAGLGGSSGRFRRLQNGFVRSYALSMFGGAALLVVALLLVKA